jgi:hypothetical protein
MDIRVLVLLVADLAMIYAGFVYGIRFIRHHRNSLLGVEWIVVATSGANVIVLGLTGNNHDSASYHLMLFFDAFSRSVGITLILVLGMLRVTHGYKPPIIVDIGVFALATVAGLYLAQLPQPIPHQWAIFYIVVNAATSVFMVYFSIRLWIASERTAALGVLLATILGSIVAGIYDFVSIPGDDADHTLFYTIALATWALMLTAYYFGYRALDRSAHHADDTALADRRSGPLPLPGQQ